MLVGKWVSESEKVNTGIELASISENSPLPFPGEVGD